VTPPTKKPLKGLKKEPRRDAEEGCLKVDFNGGTRAARKQSSEKKNPGGKGVQAWEKRGEETPMIRFDRGQRRGVILRKMVGSVLGYLAEGGKRRFTGKTYKGLASEGSQSDRKKKATLIC